MLDTALITTALTAPSREVMIGLMSITVDVMVSMFALSVVDFQFPAHVPKIIKLVFAASPLRMQH